AWPAGRSTSRRRVTARRRTSSRSARTLTELRGFRAALPHAAQPAGKRAYRSSRVLLPSFAGLPVARRAPRTSSRTSSSENRAQFCGGFRARDIFFGVRLGTCLALEFALAAGAVLGVAAGAVGASRLAGDYLAEPVAAA